MDDRAFADRRAAGKELAERLQAYHGRNDVVVLALPRGGVPVAHEVAEALGAPLDLFLVRKLGTPGHRELAMGAIASGGVRVLNDDVVRWFDIPPARLMPSPARNRESSSAGKPLSQRPSCFAAQESRRDSG
jgi:predicted phosphoribosyltransferase